MIQTVRAQVTGGTLPAAVPFNAVVAGQGLVANDIQLAPVVGQRPGFGFIQPHQRRFEAGLFCHSQIDGVIECFHEFIPAVRVAREVGLTYARDHRFGFHLVGIDRRQGQEENVAARYEGVRNAAGIRFVIRHRNAVAGEAADGQFI